MKYLPLLPLLAMTISTAHAQDAYPARPIRLIVAFTPGSPTDLVARVVGQRMTESWGRNVVVENRSGAGGIIASQGAKRANADGHTILVTSASFAVYLSLHSDPGYTLSDFVAVARGPVTPNTISVHPTVKAKTLKELIALAKTTPMSYASSGAGGTPFLNMEQLFRVNSGVQITHVPMAGPPQAVAAAVANQVPIVATAMATQVPQIRAGAIRPVAVTSAARSSILPDVPTVAESGFAGFADHTWFSFLAPAGTPPAIVNKLNTEINRILQLPESKTRLSSLSLEFTPYTPAEFATELKAEAAKYAKMVKETGARAE
jgi:tripartite-type tricarboxylate transporter receptor subunit TctC